MEEKAKAFKSCARNLKFSPVATKGGKEWAKELILTQPSTTATCLKTTMVDSSRSIEGENLETGTKQIPPTHHLVSTSPLTFSAGCKSPKKTRKFKVAA